MWHNAKFGGSVTAGAGLEPAPTDLRHSVLYQPITPKFVITSNFYIFSIADLTINL